MKSFTKLRNLYGSLTNNTSSANLTLGDELINDSIRTIATIRGGRWWWLEAEKTILSVASQSSYKIPSSIRKISDVYVIDGNNYYTPRPVENISLWKNILASNMGSSDYPMWYYRNGDSIEFQPVPATSGLSIVIKGRNNIKDLMFADYTTGTITSIANGASTVIGSGTNWTTKMIGRYIRITDNGSANTGDNLWYEIANVTSATTLTINTLYEGTTISVGTSAYTIGEMSVIPESYDIAPVYRAVAIYWDMQGETSRSKRYWNLYDGGKETGESNVVGGLIGNMIEEDDEKIEGNYIPRNLINEINSDPNIPPRDINIP